MSHHRAGSPGGGAGGKAPVLLSRLGRRTGGEPPRRPLSLFIRRGRPRRSASDGAGNLQTDEWSTETGYRVQTH